MLTGIEIEFKKKKNVSKVDVKWDGLMERCFCGWRSRPWFLSASMGQWSTESIQSIPRPSSPTSHSDVFLSGMELAPCNDHDAREQHLEYDRNSSATQINTPTTMSNKPDKSSFLRSESELALDLVSRSVREAVDWRSGSNIQRLGKRKKRR